MSKTLRDAAQSLIDCDDHGFPRVSRTFGEAIQVLRAALAAEQAQPVAWMTEDGERVVSARTMNGARKDGGAILSSLRPYSVPLYTAQQTAVPLTLYDITKIASLEGDFIPDRNGGAYIFNADSEARYSIVSLVRAVERAHGIGKESGDAAE